MTQDALKIISDGMAALSLNYEFMEYSSTPSYPYFVGEYSETDTNSEDGRQEATFILNGFSKETWLELEQAKEQIREYFPETGLETITESGAIVVAYSNSFPVPTGDAAMKRIQINLIIKEWKVK